MVKKVTDKIPEYRSTNIFGRWYFYTSFTDEYGKRKKVYAKTRRELYSKAAEKARLAEEERERRENPTVAEYCDRWLQMQSAYVKQNTLEGYTRTLKKYLVEPLGDQYMSEITGDTLKMALMPLSDCSSALNRTVNMLVKSVFYSYEANFDTEYNPSKKISLKGGKPKKEKPALTNEQVKVLLETVKGLPPEPFVRIGLYAGLRREEILALKWDSVFLDIEKPYIWVRRAWHCDHNMPVVNEEMKSKSSNRKIPIPRCLANYLRELREKSQSEYVVTDSNGKCLNYTQYRRMWDYIKVRTAGDRKIYKWVNGQKIEKTLHVQLGDHCVNRPNLVCTLDFTVSPHQLRYTYITNLIHKNVDPKTVQYLAGHKSSKLTMDVYARVKYNRPEELAPVIKKALEKE